VKSAVGILLGLCFSLLFFPPAAFAEKPLLKLKGSYFAYSYDLNQVYGENVEFEFLGYRVSGRTVMINIASRSFCLYGQVVMASDQERVAGDEFWFSPKEPAGVLLTYGDTVLAKEYGKAGDTPLSSLIKDLNDVGLPRIQKSMIYLTAKAIDITASYEVYGYQVRLFVEGVESLGFKKLNLTSGLRRQYAGVTVNKIWFNRAQGLIVSLSHSYDKPNRLSAHSQVYYEEHTLAKNYVGLNRQFDVMTNLNANFAKNLNLAVNGNYNSSNLWNMNAVLNKKWGDAASTRIDLAYNKPVNYKGEGWLGFQTGFRMKKMGEIQVGGKYGSGDQLLGSISYSNIFLKSISLLLTSTYSKLGIFGAGEKSEIWSGNITASFSSKIFNLATDYFMNRDLVGHQNLSQPRLTLSFNQFDFYGGLLSFRLMNIFIFNESRSPDSRQRSFSNNLSLSLGAKPISIQKTLTLNLNLSLEQFLEMSRRNFTSGGVIITAVKKLGRSVTLEGFYSVQSRRKTQGWFVEGTTSQDLSMVFRVNRPTGPSGWLSVSYDPKRNEWRTLFAELSIRFSQVWQFHSLACYDFFFDKINNVDLFLTRDAGRFQLRFVWRSLSRQFVVELTPK
jgi:hypothetical protein